MQNSCDLLIKNGNVVIPKSGIIQTNIFIENGKIKKLSKNIDNISSDKILDASKKFILPGLIDPHVHYGVYTPIEIAAKTESRSAAIGGITTIIRMLRLDSQYRERISEQLDASAKSHYIDYTVHPSILTNEHLDDIPYLYNNIGINSFKLYMNLGSGLNHIYMDLNPKEKDIRGGHVNITNEFLEKIVKTTTHDFNGMLLVHAEDPQMCYDMIKNKITDNKKQERRKRTVQEAQ